MRIPLIQTVASVVKNEFSKPIIIQGLSHTSLIRLALASFAIAKEHENRYQELKKYGWAIIPTTILFSLWDNQRINRYLHLPQHTDIRHFLCRPAVYLVASLCRYILRNQPPESELFTLQVVTLCATLIKIAKLKEKLFKRLCPSHSHNLTKALDIFTSSLFYSMVAVSISSLCKKILLEEKLRIESQTLLTSFSASTQQVQTSFNAYKLLHAQLRENKPLDHKIFNPIKQISEIHNKYLEYDTEELESCFNKLYGSLFGSLFDTVLTNSTPLYIFTSTIDKIQFFARTPEELYQILQESETYFFLLENTLKLSKQDARVLGIKNLEELQKLCKENLEAKENFLAMYRAENSETTVVNRISTFIADTEGLQQGSLDLSNLYLMHIPPVVFEIPHLRHLHLSRNPMLTDACLPERLALNSEIESIFISGTQISERKKDELVDEAKQRRIKKQLDNELNFILKKWEKTFPRSKDAFRFIKSLENQHQATIAVWLERSETMQMYAHGNRATKQRILDLIEELLNTIKDQPIASSPPSFLDSFLVHAERNNRNCGDRAGMTFNEMYTLLELFKLEKSDARFEEKIKVCIAAAKVFCLRKKIANEIQEKLPHLKLNVEIYLYFETILKDQLGLLSFLSSMEFGRIGNRSEIDKYALQNHVAENYLTELFALDVFKTFIESNEEFLLFKEKKQQKLDKRQEQLDDDLYNNRITQQDYKSECEKTIKTYQEFPKLFLQEKKLIS